MRQSQLFTKTFKQAPKDEVAKNAELLIRAGIVHKEMAGVYTFLPLGLRVLNKIIGIIREEMNAVGGQEVLLSALHPVQRYVDGFRALRPGMEHYLVFVVVGGVDDALLRAHSGSSGAGRVHAGTSASPLLSTTSCIPGSASSAA